MANGFLGSRPALLPNVGRRLGRKLAPRVETARRARQRRTSNAHGAESVSPLRRCPQVLNIDDGWACFPASPLAAIRLDRSRRLRGCRSRCLVSPTPCQRLLPGLAYLLNPRRSPLCAPLEQQPRRVWALPCRSAHVGIPTHASATRARFASHVPMRLYPRRKPPRVRNPSAKTRRMQLANALCCCAELARAVTLS